jgi:Baseplate J-like protein
VSVRQRATGCSCGCADCGCADQGLGVACTRPVPGPGLAALPFRLGTHARFLRGMQSRLSGSDRPALSALGTRDPADPTVALLEAWASMLDVLTFYGERILNEGYLRTATEGFSVEALARLVGYAPRPGVAASLHLAYTLEAGHADVPVLTGSRAQSVPAPGELPQSFETVEDLLAQAPLSVMRARLTRPPLVLPGRIESRDYFLKGLGTNLRANDTLLFTFGTGSDAKRALMDVHSVDTEAAQGRTRVTLAFHRNNPKGVDEATTTASRLFHLLSSEHLAELNLKPEMPSVQRLAGLVQRYAEHPVDTELGVLRGRLKAEGQIADQQGWKNVGALIGELTGVLGNGEALLNTAVQASASPQSTFTRILGELRKAPSVQPASALLLKRSVHDLIGGAHDSAPKLYAALYPQLRPQLYAALASAQVTPEAALTNVDALRVKAALFGANLPRSIVLGAAPVNFENAWEDVLGLPDGVHDVPAVMDPPVDVLALNGEHSQIKLHSWIAVERPAEPGQPSNGKRTLSFHQIDEVETVSVSSDPLAYTARVTVLKVSPAWLDQRGPWFKDRRLLRETAVYAAAEPLELTPEVLESPVGGDDEIELDGLYRGLNTGRFIVLEGERDDLTATQLRDAELGMVAGVEHRLASTPDGTPWPDDTLHTFVKLAAPLQFRFRRDSLQIYGNVARATHGETRTEVLGDGDGSAASQAFTLKQGPLTYLPAVTPSGAQSTLTVRVNGLRWSEVPRPAAAGPDRRYLLTTDAQGKTTVRFLARLPSGRENLTATYRSGLGRGGNVAAGQVTLLMSKPLGVKAVVNPLRASGGADREGRDQIRRHAPLATLTLDRLVSVRDHQDFARTFAGIGKASARRFAFGGRPTVHLTVAGADDAPVRPDSDLYRTLVAALRRYGDPGQAVRLSERDLRLLVVEADVQIDPDRLWKDVEARLRRTLLEAFGFAARELAQGVQQAEVLATMHQVPGVTAVRLNVLDTVGEAELRRPDRPKLTLKTRVAARPARMDPALGLQPAELLILTPDVAETLVLRPWTQGSVIS